jgi:uncharacterized membrane protein (Fun14 family)
MMPLLYIGFSALIVLVVGMALKDLVGELVKFVVGWAVRKVREWRGRSGL